MALAARRPPVEREGDEFARISREEGLTAALNWRDQKLGMNYRTAADAAPKGDGLA